MAKRKSLNRRLSRYSGKSSFGSGILDPDTNILEDEQPLWWKNLENNTIVRPSLEFSLYNQTSDCLDPNSQLQSTQPADEWWKALDASNTDIPNNSKPVGKDAENANIVVEGDVMESSTSDSERETGTRKRKIPIRGPSRRSRGSNAFLKALNDSRGSEVSEPLKRRSRNRGDSFVSNEELSDRQLRSRRSDANQESNADQSSNVDDVMKRKPSIFKKRNVDSGENVFNDILREEMQSNHTPSKVKENKSVKTPVNEKLKVSRINSVESRLPALQDDENDFLNLSAPKAQSSVLEDSNVSAKIADKENEISDKSENSRSIILKPKTKFLKRLRLEQDGFDDNYIVNSNAKNDRNKRTKSTELNAEKQHSPRKSLSSSVDNVFQQVIEESVTNKNHGRHSTKRKKLKSRSSKMSLEKELLSVQEIPSQAHKDNTLSTSTKNKNSDISTDSENHTEIVKARSKFLRNTRKSLGKNAFDQVFANNESNNISKVISEEPGKNVIDENEPRNANGNNNDVESNSGSSISLKLSYSSDGNSKKISEQERMISDDEVELRTATLNEMPSTEHRESKEPRTPNISVPNNSISNTERSKRMSMSRGSVNVNDDNIMNESDVSDRNRTKGKASLRKTQGKNHSAIPNGNSIESNPNDISEIEDNLELNNEIQPEALQENDDAMSDENHNRSMNQIKATATNTPIAEKSFASPLRDAEPQSMNKKSSPFKKSIVKRPSVSAKKKTVNKRKSKNVSHVSFEVDKAQSRRQNESSSRIQKSITSHEASRNVSNNLTKTSMLTSQRNIDDFFKKKSPQKTDQQSISIDQPGSSNSRIFTDENRMKGIKEQINKIKTQVMASLNTDKQRTQNTQVPFAKKKVLQKKKKISKVTEEEFNQPASQVDKAYLVNGKVYKRPKLPRPKQWATDRLYHYLWKHMEPKCKLMTRVYSERFVQQLAEVVTLVTKRKKYENYRDELDALMKEMARLNIIRTRNDFYDFCYDFLPYEFRMKATPILLPGCKRTIPYDPETLHKPLLDD